MIKLLDDLLIAATCNPNVPGAIVAGLRQALNEARAALPSPTSAPVNLGYDKMLDDLRGASPWPQEAEPATVRVSSSAMHLQAEVDTMAKEIVATIEAINLPPPFDSLEEAQRAAGIMPPAADLSYYVRLVAGDGCAVGDVAANLPWEPVREPPVWAPCDVAGWVVDAYGIRPPQRFEYRGSREPGKSPTDWRPLPPTPSALDEMAEQVADTKPTNPKDAAATGRVPLGLLSPIAKAHWALAQHCGRAKYGAWNWREAGARASIYLDAIGRHADGYLSGETYDPVDNTHHLGNVMACCAILLEAEAAGKLVDDRPPTLDMRATYADVEKRQADLTAKYSDRNPKHWTR